MESDLIDRSEVLPVLSVHMPVLTATDIVVTKLHALDEHYCDFARLLPVARALREQVDWSEVEREVADNDFAAVFLILLERLGVVPARAQREHRPSDGKQVRPGSAANLSQGGDRPPSSAGPGRLLSD